MQNYIQKYTNIKEEDLTDVAENLWRMIIEDYSDLRPENNNSFIIFLRGQIGAGKTSFVKKLAKTLKINKDVQSPTFTIMREYDIDDVNYKKYFDKLIHIDAYRFEDKNESSVLNLEKYILEKNLIIIEWPENMLELSPDYVFDFELSEADENARNIYVQKR
jgi:tRNA threonylcarbamoyladenosine biosynthesis protein TsaE